MGLVIFYCCLLIPCLLYLLITLFGGGDIVADDVDCQASDSFESGYDSDFRLTLSSLCYFLIGFSSAGLLFVPYGTLISITAGLATGIVCYFTLAHVFNWIIHFCFSSEVTLSEPEEGDECVTLSETGTDDVGSVRIFKRVGIDNHVDKAMTYFAVSEAGNIKSGVSCIVTKVGGDRVVIKPLSETNREEVSADVSQKE